MKTVILNFDGSIDKAYTAIKSVKDTIKEMYAMGVTLALTSNREREALETLLEELNLSDYFSVLVTPEESGGKRLSSDMVNKVLEYTDGEPSQVLVVGEDENYIDMGRTAGAKTCAIKKERCTQSSHNADYVIDDIRGLLDIV